MTLHTRETVTWMFDVTCDGCGIEHGGVNGDGYFITDTDDLAEVLEAEDWLTAEDRSLDLCPQCALRFELIVMAFGGESCAG